jgi:hypothetical protein
VSTPFSELKNYEDVTYKAKTPGEFAEKINIALQEDCAEKITQRRTRVKQASWESKAELVLRKLFED